MGADAVEEADGLVHAVLEIGSVPAPEILSGDLGELIESSARGR
jgi:hypothetical protein